MKYRRVVIEHTGGPEVMRLVDEELPEPRSGEARVRVLAADVSFSDVNVRRGRYPGAPRPPLTPGYAMVGEIDRLGPGVTVPAVGARVAALTFYGSYSEYVFVPARELVVAPAAVDPADAVSLVLSYTAAYQMLHRVAHVERGSRILVHGAAGGVGTAFLELGHRAGLEMYGTASKRKHPLVSRMGATPIDYRAEDFVERVGALSGGRGVDAAFDPMGSAHLARSVTAVRRAGSVVAYGFYETADRGGHVLLDIASQYVRLALWSLPPRRMHVSFYDVRPYRKSHPEWFREDLATLFGMLAAGDLRPVIAGRLPLEDAARAHEQVEHAEVQGKLVLVPHGPLAAPRAVP